MIRNQILQFLQAHKVPFQHLMHKETDPHRVSAELGVEVSEGIKCLILRGKKSQKNTLICLRGHQRVDMRAVSALLGESCEFESVETVKQRFGLDVGAIPPFGALLGLDAYFDSGLQDCQEVIFSCGVLNESIRLKFSDLIPLIHPKFAPLSKLQ